MKQIAQLTFAVAMLTVLTKCSSNTSQLQRTVKHHPDDPFASTIPSSQYFDIDGNVNEVVQGQTGTVIFFPKGCFRNSKGEVIIENIKVELMEALSIDKMLLSNLTTTSDGEPLETGGMLYLNATANGEQLLIDDEKPVYVEIPTSKKKAGMMVYKGVRDNEGNMNWIDPKPLKKFLIPVDLEELDFLPSGFSAHVEHGMPFRNYNTATRELIDSLYYSLSVSDGSELIKGLIDTDINEPYYEKGKRTGSIDSHSPFRLTQEEGHGESDAWEMPSNCGVDPAIIKVLKSKRFQNSLISTREFEKRLQTIFKTCRNDILEVYVNGLEKNLWELDSTVAEMLPLDESHELDHLHFEFRDFADERLTNVENASERSQALREFYAQRLKKVKMELEKAKDKAVLQLESQNKMAEEVKQDYKKLLFERESYRMETYGFELTETGWINVDRGTEPKDWGSQRLEMLVENGSSYDKVFTYVIYTSIKSLYRLNSDDQELYYVGNSESREMLMPKRGQGVGIAIAYRDESVFFAMQEFNTEVKEVINLVLKSSTQDEIKKATARFDEYSRENKIHDDIEYMVLLWKEERRHEKLMSEYAFIHDLRQNVLRCCELPVPEEIRDEFVKM